MEWIRVKVSKEGTLDIKSELIWRAVVALVSVFVLAKIFAFLFKSWMDKIFSYKKEKETLEDFDDKIQTMVDRMQQGTFGPVVNKSLSPEGSPSPGKSGLKNVTPTKGGIIDQYVDKINEELQQLQKENKDKEANYLNLKEMLGIFENVRWGSGKVFQFLANEMSKSLSVSIDQGRISRCVIDLMREDAFQIEGNWSVYKDALTLIKTRLVLEILIQECVNCKNQEKGEALFPFLAKHYSKEKDLFFRSFKLFIGKVEGKPWEILLKEVEQGELVKESIPSWAGSLPKKLLTKIVYGQFSYPLLSTGLQGKVLSYHDIFHLLHKETELIEKVTNFQRSDEHMTSLEEEKVQQSLKLLGLKWESSEEEAKSAFNQLAKRNHPDRMHGMNISPEKMKMVNEKFAEIKNAYDLVKVIFKKRKKIMEILKG